MNKKTLIIMMTVSVFLIATAFIVWFLLSETPVETPVEASSEVHRSGPCRGDVYGMIYQYDSSGKCVPIRCEAGYTNIGGQCIFDGSDTSNLVLPTYNNTSYTRAGRVGWRLGKMRF